MDVNYAYKPSVGRAFHAAFSSPSVIYRFQNPLHYNKQQQQPERFQMLLRIWIMQSGSPDTFFFFGEFAC